MASSCSRKKHSKWYLNLEELKHKAGLRVVERIVIFETASHFNQYYLILQNILCTLSGLVLIWNFFEETYLFHLHVYFLACFYEMHLKFLLSHIHFHLNDSKLWKQNQSVSEEMMWADMQFRNSWATWSSNQGMCNVL